MRRQMTLQDEQGKIPVILADSFLSRFLGLMGRKEAPEGLLLEPCSSVHTCFMRYDLDVFFLDRDNRIVAVKRGMKPWRATPVFRKAHRVAEFPSRLGVLRAAEPGTVLVFEK